MILQKIKKSTVVKAFYASLVVGVLSFSISSCNDDSLIEDTSLIPTVQSTALFTAEVDELDVTFSNISLDVTEFLWDFGDGNTSAEEAPVHTYTEYGDYTVTLTTTNTAGVTFTNTADISVIRVEFDFEIVDNTITFTNLSQAISESSWSFGDGNTSTEEAPTHTYDAIGEFTVTLTGTSENGLVFNTFSTEVNVETLVVVDTGVDDDPVEEGGSDVVELAEFSGQFVAINDTTPDTGELRIDLGTDYPKGRMTVVVNKAASNADGFVALYGGSTSGSNSLIDMRLGEGDGENFSTRNNEHLSFNQPAFVPGTDYAIEITWDATATDGSAPLLTMSINGESVSDMPFASGGALAEVQDGVRNVQFRFGTSSGTVDTAENFAIDSLTVYDTSSGTGVVVFTDDFESYALGSSIDPNGAPEVAGVAVDASSPYHNNSAEPIITE